MTEHQANHGNMTSIAFVFSLIMLFSSCRSLEIMESKSLTVPVDDQGRVEDFSRHLTSHLYENGMLVGVGNDEKYLYIFFSPDIRHYQRPPSRASLKLWLDAGGGQEKIFGFLLTVVPPFEKVDGERPGTKGTTPGPGTAGPPPAPQRDELLLQFIDEVGKKHAFISTDGSQGPQIRFSSDWGDFVYAWRIPFAAGEKRDFYGLGARPGQVIGIGLLWDCKPLPAAQKPAGRPDDGPPAGGGGTPGGGRPGRGGPGMSGGMGNRPGPGDDMAEAPTRRKIWLKIILAQK
jgi:hypothetical protein